MADQPNQPKMARTVTPDGSKCRAFRLAKGWDEDAMAAVAGCTRKTVGSVENGNSCFVCTLKGFSDAFGLSDMRELLANPEAYLAPVPSGQRVQVKIKLDLPFAESDFTRWLIWLVNRIISIIDPRGEMEVVAIAPGSIVITLEMDGSDSRKTISAFGEGELAGLNIDSMITNFGHGDPIEFKPILKTPAQPRLRQLLPAPPVPTAPQKSLMAQLSIWLFGEASSNPDPYKDSAQYRDRGAGVFGRRKKDV